jgi:protein phosphatase inhibitor 2
LEQGRTNPCPFVAFEEHRKVHYDEYHKMKELLQKGTMTDDAEEDECVPDNRKE